MLREYVERLKRLVKLEREAEIKAMMEEIKRLSGEERERLGRAILNLDGKIVGSEFEFKLVKYGRRVPFKTEIGVGDLVLISKGNPLESDLVGVVTEKGNRYIVVALEKVPKWALKGVRIDLYANDVTFRRMLENLEKMNESVKRVLEFCLGISKPGDVRRVEFKPEDRGLNESQRDAVSLALGSDDFFLIHGPFGTGKTRTLVELIVQEVRRGKKVLATAESNVAVDNLVERLLGRVRLVRVGHPSRVSRSLKEATLSYQVQSHPRYEEVRRLREEAERLMEERDKYKKPIPSLRRGLSDDEIVRLAKVKREKRGLSLDVIRSMANWIRINRRVQHLLDKARRVEEEIAREVLEKAEVVLSTNSSSAVLDMEFDVAVIDEATQATIPSVLIPISKAKRFVLAGDHKQLPPTVLSEEAKELMETLFEKLIEMYPEKSKMLEIQYRMNEKIMNFPNFEFYGGRLKADESVRRITIKDLGAVRPRFGKPWDDILREDPVVFVDTSKCSWKWERQRKGSSSRENPLEAVLAVKIARMLVSIGVRSEDIGIITPYDDQVDLIRLLCRDSFEVNTVDGYQGREKEVVIISFVRSNRNGELGFLTDLRRLNTAITRARRKLICIGDSETLSSNETYSRFIEYVKREGRFVVVDEEVSERLKSRFSSYL